MKLLFIPEVTILRGKSSISLQNVLSVVLSLNKFPLAITCVFYCKVYIIGGDGTQKGAAVIYEVCYFLELPASRS